MKKLVILLICLSLVLTCNLDKRRSYIHFERPARTLPIIDVIINFKPAKFLLDTGAGTSIVDINQLWTYYLQTDTIPTGYFGGIGGLQSYYNTTGLRYFQVGEKDYNIAVKSVDLTTVVESFENYQHVHILGVIGSDFFDKYQARIDYGTNTLSLTP